MSSQPSGTIKIIKVSQKLHEVDAQVSCPVFMLKEDNIKDFNFAIGLHFFFHTYNT